MTYLNKTIAFTLAETLVVMGIIGVVAALTIPNLNQSTGDREKVAKVKKIYANLEDAYGRATAVYGPLEEWFVNDNKDSKSTTNRFADRMTEFMKISKDCGSEPKGCFAEEYKDLRYNYTSKISDMWSEYTQRYFLLADGTGVFFQCFTDTAFIECSSIVDLDGPKGSNTWGKDMFLFLSTDELGQFYFIGAEDVDKDPDYVVRNCCDGGGKSCAYWIVQTGNMDYLKADANCKCPNGTKLSFENPTCK